jgi:hypothetical protein
MHEMDTVARREDPAKPTPGLDAQASARFSTMQSRIYKFLSRCARGFSRLCVFPDCRAEVSIHHPAQLTNTS